MRKVRSIEDKIIHIVDTRTGRVETLEPKATESCMEPGTFHIVPIEVWEDDVTEKYCIGTAELSARKEDIAEGVVRIEEEPFAPKVVRPKNSCNPCRNCGRC